MGDWEVEAYMEGINEIFDSTKGEYNHFFLVIAIILNFMHRHHMDFTYEVIGDQI
jgi:hypothetical protein